MKSKKLGRDYTEGEIIIRQGEIGDCMFVIQEGEVDVVRHDADGREIVVAVLRQGDFFGEMAIFEKEVRSATVRAKGETRVLTIDKKTFLKRVKQDPTLAFNLLKIMSQRIRSLDEELLRNSEFTR
jgi:CRP-like cAMP-binding protein